MKEGIAVDVLSQLKMLACGEKTDYFVIKCGIYRMFLSATRKSLEKFQNKNRKKNIREVDFPHQCRSYFLHQ